MRIGDAAAPAAVAPSLTEEYANPSSATKRRKTPPFASTHPKKANCGGASNGVGEATELEKAACCGPPLL